MKGGHDLLSKPPTYWRKWVTRRVSQLVAVFNAAKSNRFPIKVQPRPNLNDALSWRAQPSLRRENCIIIPTIYHYGLIEERSIYYNSQRRNEIQSFSKSSIDKVILIDRNSIPW